jgi:polysaccharide biosynthesis protein PslH
MQSPRQNLLYLVHRLPYPPDKGDRIRAFHVLKHLAGRAHVFLACLADEPVGAQVEAVLRRYCTDLAIVPIGRAARAVGALSSILAGRTATEGAFHSRALRDILQDWCRRTPFAAVLASASSMAPYLELEVLRQVPAIVDLVDVDSQKWLDYAAASAWPATWLYAAEGRRLRRVEQALAAQARGVTLVTDAEAALYRNFCPTGQVSVVPNGVDLDYFRPAKASMTPVCAFTGALDYRPNVDGVCWFCKHVWPALHRQRPDAEFHIIGRKPVAAVRRLARLDGVHVIGQVPDVRPYLRRAAVAVVPLRIARGIQNKILEALALGLPTVASPASLSGLPAEPGRELLAAETPEEWTTAIQQLFDDPGLRQRLGAAGRRYVEHRHSWQQCLAGFDELLGLGDGADGSKPQPNSEYRMSNLDYRRSREGPSAFHGR